MQNRNNLIVLYGITAILFLCCIPLTWFSFDQVMGSWGTLETPGLSLNGMASNITILVALPVWLLLVGSALATALLLLNAGEVTTIPRPLPLAMLIGCAAHYGVTFFIDSVHVRSGAGPVVALINTLLVLILVFKDKPAPTPTPVRAPGRTAAPSVPGRSRLSPRNLRPGNN